MQSPRFNNSSFYIALVFCLVGAWLTGCSRSNETADTAPLDIRGEPINSGPSKTEVASAAPEQAVAPTNAMVAVVTPPPGSTAAVQKSTEPIAVTFDKLASYEFVMPDETVTTNGIVSSSSKVLDPFPAEVKAFDQSRVALKGFMLPLKVEGGLVTEMLIMRDQSMCCYGKVPKITEWVSVKMSDKGVKPVIDQPVTIFGKLHVGEMRENGYLVGIYRMDGEGMTTSE